MQKRQTPEKGFALLINEYVENSLKEQRKNLTELANIVFLIFEGKLPGVAKGIRARPTGSTPVEIVSTKVSVRVLMTETVSDRSWPW